MSFIENFNSVIAFLVSLFQKLWGVIVKSDFALAFFLLPLAAFIAVFVFELFSRIADPQSITNDMSDSGIVGFIKRVRKRQERRKEQAYADSVLQDSKYAGMAWVEIDGTRYMRNMGNRKRVRFGGKVTDYRDVHHGYWDNSADIHVDDPTIYEDSGRDNSPRLGE